MGRYFFKIQATADDPNKVLMGQFLPIICGQFPPELDPLDCGYKYTEDAWSRIRAFCPEEIDWDFQVEANGNRAYIPMMEMMGP